MITTTPGQDYIVLEILDVDIPTRQAHCFDKTKASLVASFIESPGGLLRIPSQGERWTAKRQGWIWHLEAKLDKLEDHAFAQDSMAPGDLRLQSSGNMFVQGTRVEMNGRGIGPDIKDTFYNDTSFTSVILTSEAVSAMSTHPALNGIDLDPNLWYLEADNRTISFHNTMGPGFLVVSYQSWATAMDDIATVTGRGVISGVEEFVPALQVIAVSGNTSAAQFGTVTYLGGPSSVSVPGKTSAAQFGTIATIVSGGPMGIFGTFYLGQDPPA